MRGPEVLSAANMPDEMLLAVLADLDPADRAEAEVMLGAYSDAGLLALMRSASVLELACHAGEPFALMALAPGGYAGVGSAALLARDHARHAGPLARLTARLRRELPGVVRGLGFNRLEARSWNRHPQAGRILSAIGFRREAFLKGFGPGGCETVEQWAWVAGRNSEE